MCDNASVTLKVVIGCTLYNLHILYWRGCAALGFFLFFFFGLKIHLETSLSCWVGSGPLDQGTTFPVAKFLSVVFIFPKTTAVVLIFLKQTAWELRCDQLQEPATLPGGDPESLEKLCPSRPYSMH